MGLGDSLISYWKLDETSGNAIDSHGPNTLTDNNTVGSAAGKIGGARDFEVGNSEFFSIASNASVQTGNIDFTLSVWVNAESFPVGLPCGIVSKWRDSFPTNIEYWILYDNATQRFGFWVSNVFDGATNKLVLADELGTPSLSTWYHIIAWHDAANDEIGIVVNNGTPDTELWALGVYVGNCPFVIGAYDAGARFWDGLIDEVGFWKRVLTPDERAALYNGGSGLPYPFADITTTPSMTSMCEPPAFLQPKKRVIAY